MNDTFTALPPSSLLEELQEDKRVITAGLAASIEAAKRLLKIRQTRSYLFEADTFEAFCQANWEFGASRARQICAEARVVESLNLPEGSVTLGNASQVRALMGLPVAERAAVFEEIKATAPDGVVTRRHVEQIVRARKGQLGIESVTTGNALGAVAAAAAGHGNGMADPASDAGFVFVPAPRPVLHVVPPETSLSDQASRTLTELRALVAMANTRGSSAAADLVTALARVEKFRAQLATDHGLRTTDS